MNKVTKVTKEKVTKDGLRVVCGACGQVAVLSVAPVGVFTLLHKS